MFSQYYLSESDPSLLSQPGVLAVVQFNDGCCAPGELGVVNTGLRALGAYRSEVLQYSDRVAERGLSDGCHWSVIGDVCCIATWLSDEQCQGIEHNTYAAYERMLRWLADQGFTYPLRTWNFIPNINQGQGDQEEYKKFCCGRYRAFAQANIDERAFPAASALGHYSRGAAIYILASSKPGQYLENPLQKPAYHYPREYGPRSPSFARACLSANDHKQVMFVSGTASIRGHETLYENDIVRQFAVTTENIQALLNAGGEQAYELTAIRAYLRSAGDLEPIQNCLEQHFPNVQKVILQADICRSNLSLEIEALAQSCS